MTKKNECKKKIKKIENSTIEIIFKYVKSFENQTNDNNVIFNEKYDCNMLYNLLIALIEQNIQNFTAKMKKDQTTFSAKSFPKIVV